MKKINNKSKLNNLTLLLNLWKIVEKKRKKQIFFLLILNIANGFTEAISIASLIPFLSVIINPSRIWSISKVREYSQEIGIFSPSELILPIGLIFIFAIIFSTAIRILNIWISNYLSAVIGYDLSCKAFENAINQPYEKHLENNSNDLLAANTTLILQAVITIYAALQFIAAIILSIFLLISIFILNWFIAVISALLICLIYFTIIITVKKRYVLNSAIIVRETTKQIKSMQEGMGSMRDILMSNTQDLFLKVYSKSDWSIRKKNSENNFLNVFPKQLIEGLGMIFIASLALLLSNFSGNQNSVLPLLGTLALIAQRLLPTSQLIYSSWANIRSKRESLKKIIDMASQNVEIIKDQNKIKPLLFKKSIRLSNISFKFQNKNYIFKDLNLEIKKGEKVGVFGKTGGGKSTLIDIVSGLIDPIKGDLLVDEKKVFVKENLSKIKAWRAAIAHVPQTIFISDRSLVENIAFGIPKENINFELIKKVAKEAEIDQLIIGNQEDFKYRFGERGKRLSGGQRQRIGIARGLYKQSNVLILDESTSALDNKTEKAVIKNITDSYPHLTLIMIAHRLSTLQNCDKLIEVHNGKLIIHR